jgi:CRISPR/Cas system-associated exonuclease Cas4 (RecB family)
MNGKIRPSKLGDLCRCPKFEYVTDTASTDDGKRLHAAFETADYRDCSPSETEFMQAAALTVEGYTRSLPQPVSVYSEMKVYIPVLDVEGTIDKLLLSKRRAVVVDLKSGALGIPSAAADNMQIKCYVTGVLHKYPDLEEAQGLLFNPRTQDLSDDLVITRAQLPEVEAEINAVKVRVEDPFSAPTPGPHCAKCLHSAGCWGLKPTIMDAARNVFALPPAAFNPAAVDLTPEHRALRFFLKSALANWCEQVADADKSYVAAGNPVPPGLKQVTRSNGVRIAKDLKLDAARRLRDVGISPDTLDAAATYSLSDLAEALAVERNMSEPEAKKFLLDVLHGMTRESVSTFLQKDRKFDVRALLGEGGAVIDVG